MDHQKPLRRLITYASEFRHNVVRAASYSILNKLFDLAPPLLIGAAVDIVVRRENSIFGLLGINDLFQQLITLSLLTFAIWSFESIFEYLYKVQWRNLSQKVEHKLRMDVYTHIQELDLEYFGETQTGRLMAVLNNDINQMERFLDIGANDMIQVSTTVITIGIAFFVLSPIIGTIAAIPIPIIVLFSIKYQGLLESKYANMREKVSILNGRLSNNLSGIATIKSYTAESYEADRIADSSMDYQVANREAIMLSSAFSPLIRIIIVVAFIFMMVVGGMQTLNGQIEVATYSVIVFLIQRLLWPLTRLGETFDQYQRAMASTNRALDLLAVQPKIVSGPIRYPLEQVEGHIEFDDVTFGYRGRDLILKNFSIEIQPGQTIAFVGATGAGKSTIIKLLLRYYDPKSGVIRTDSHNIREVNLQDLRSAFGLVSQDTFLIDGTIRENIAYGHPNTPLENIIEAAKIAEVHKFIQSLPQQYDTLVGERGQKLSGGQRQRVSIARAVLKNPPIMIFDEATSSVDNETEAAIQRSLEKLIVGRTTIIIAHRLSTIRNADHIYVLADGSIIEQGTHEKLVTHNGLYSSLWKVQTGEILTQYEL